MKDIDKKIKEYEKKLEELRVEKARLEAMPQNQRLAEILHDKLCHWNHTDGCGWFYDSWKKPGSAHHEYLKKADDMLSEMSFDEAMKIIKHL